MPGLVMPCSRRMRHITRWAFLTAGCRPTQRRSSGSPSTPPRRSTRYSRRGSLAWPRCGVSSTGSPRPSSIGCVVASRRTHIQTGSTSCAAASRWCSRKRPSITVTRYATSPCSRPVPEPGQGAHRVGTLTGRSDFRPQRRCYGGSGGIVVVPERDEIAYLVALVVSAEVLENVGHQDADRAEVRTIPRMVLEQGTVHLARVLGRGQGIGKVAPGVGAHM